MSEPTDEELRIFAELESDPQLAHVMADKPKLWGWKIYCEERFLVNLYRAFREMVEHENEVTGREQLATFYIMEFIRVNLEHQWQGMVADGWVEDDFKPELLSPPKEPS
jgi:hypothetical protein